MFSAVLIAAAIMAAVLASGAAWQRRETSRDLRRTPPAGEFIEVEPGRRLHACIAGSGSPAVVFESGVAATSISWGLVEPEVARHTTTISYDRAGLGWSDPGREAMPPSQHARELRNLLRKAGVSPPFIAVGHSFGGLVARCFAAEFATEVCGLVLVDALHPSEFHPLSDADRTRLKWGVYFARRGAMLARLGVVRACLRLVLRGSTSAPRLAGRMASGKGGQNFLDRIAGELRKLPRSTWPVMAAQWSNPKTFEAMAAQLEILPRCAAECASLRPIDIPAIVITAGRGVEEVSHSDFGLTNATYVSGHSSGHWVQFDEPELVTEAVRNLISRCLQTG